MAKNKPIWSKTKRIFPVLKQDLIVDIAIIGGGMAGISAALHLKDSGMSIVLLEKGIIGHNSSFGTGILSPGLDLDYIDQVKKIGFDKTRKIIRDDLESIAEMRLVIKKFNIDCDELGTGSLETIFSQKEKNLLEEEFKIRLKLGQRCQLIQKSAIKEVLNVNVPLILFSPDEYFFNQAKFITEVAKISSEKVHIFEETPVSEIVKVRNRYSLKTPFGSVMCKRIILTTGLKTSLGIAFPKPKIERSYALATVPLNKAQINKINWKRGFGLWSFGSKYNFIRKTNDNRLIIGGEDTSVEISQLVSSKFNNLRRYFFRLFPYLQSIQFEYEWYGDIYYTQNGLPIYKEKDNIIYFFGFGGNGLLRAFSAGKKIANKFH